MLLFAAACTAAEVERYHLDDHSEFGLRIDRQGVIFFVAELVVHAIEKGARTHADCDVPKTVLCKLHASGNYFLRHCA
jgi:hypothetical protein